MPANQLFPDWVTGDLITASKLNQMKNDLAALSGATFSGVVTVASNAGQVLNLKGGSADHVYLSLYARSADQNTRSGWIGYGWAGNDVLNIANERPGGLVAINHDILPAERGDINFNSDWNNYTIPGYYRVVAAGSSPANTPPASYTYGALLVIKAGLSLTQLYIQHIGPGTFVRQAWAGNDWQPWVELSNTNTLVLSPNLSADTNLAAGAAINIHRMRVNVPTGRTLKLKRARGYIAAGPDVIMRIINESTSSVIWSSASNAFDDTPNTTLTSTAGNFDFRVQIFNGGASTAAVFSGSGASMVFALE